MRNIDLPQILEADLPLQEPDNDKLGRARFCEDLARVIGVRKADESVAVGITGDWGTGKSTIKNFVEYNLRQLEKPPIVINFNPWEWSGQGKILTAFLRSLTDALGKPDQSRVLKKIASRLKLYSKALTMGGEFSKLGSGLFLVLGIPTVGSIFLSSEFPAAKWVTLTLSLLICLFAGLPSLFNKASDFLSELINYQGMNTDELRQDISERLSALDSPIIIFLDDLDRLSSEEIKIVFQLIKINLRFKNLTFVLLFQKDIVAKALCELNHGEGSEYISKIVQVEFDVPKASTKDAQKILFDGLDRIIGKASEAPHWDMNRWQDTFQEHLWYYFKNLRDIKRFLSSFEFYFIHHLNGGILEVDLIDLISIETLRLFEREVYNKVSRSMYLAKPSIIDLYGDSKERKELFNLKLDEMISSVDNKHDKERLKRFLSSMFPQTGEVVFHDDDANEWRRRNRICDETCFNRYFELSLDRNEASTKDLKLLIGDSSSREKVKSHFKSAIEQGTIESLLNLLFVSREEIPLNSVKPLVTALFDVGEFLPEPKKGWFGTDLSMICNKIIYHRLKDEEKAIAEEILLTAHCDTSGFILPIRHLSLEDDSTRDRKEVGEDGFNLRRERLSDFYSVNLKRIRENAQDLSLLDNKRLGYILYRWDDWAPGNEVQDWIKEVITIPEKALQLLVGLLGETHSSSGKGTTIEPTLAGEAADKLVKLEDLLSVVERIPQGKTNTLEEAGIELLRMAVNRKQAGESYEMVRPPKSSFR